MCIVAEGRSFTPYEPPLYITTIVLEDDAAMEETPTEETATADAPLLSSSAVRSDVARDTAEEDTIRTGAVWGSFEADVLAKPPVGVDALASWPSVTFFWLTFPLHLLVGGLAVCPSPSLRL